VKALEGEVKCAAVETVTLVDLLDARGDLTRGRLAHVFFLKVDVEGAEAVVLEGAKPLFEAKRVSYVLFENHAKWRPTQEAMGLEKFVTVGDVVQQMVEFGYKCAYTTPWGLVPFETPGTPEGDKGFPGCNEGLPFCARHRLYNRQVWVRGPGAIGVLRCRGELHAPPLPPLPRRATSCAQPRPKRTFTWRG
jgi:hypothetical protein